MKPVNRLMDNNNTAAVQTPLTPKYQIFDGFALKIIAIVTMFIDHAAMALMYNPYGNTDLYTVLRHIGRIAMPIFCFMIVEGLLHTRNVKKYMFRLFLCAIASEIPFNLALNAGYAQTADSLDFYGSAVFSNAAAALGDFSVILRPDSQNVLWTLLAGLICINTIEKHRLAGKKSRYILDVLLFLALCFIAELFMTDYAGLGVLLVVLFYLCRNIKIGTVSIAPAVAIILFNLSYFLYYYLFTSTIQTGELFSLVAILPLMFYNGKRGLSNSVIKYGFYAFYPVHLTILFFIDILINR